MSVNSVKILKKVSKGDKNVQKYLYDIYYRVRKTTNVKKKKRAEARIVVKFTMKLFIRSWPNFIPVYSKKKKKKN